MYLAEQKSNRNPIDGANVDIPNLFRLYLRMGTKICSLPAIDRQFKTIDFLTLFNIADLDQRHYQIFFGEERSVVTSS
ncbi:MAG: hypothetical protein KME30_13700 [Iphinoe sp. HA4291-MV1]|nr:hypothetical protein [Iphinoe sp. HA4291-MV1]